REVERVSLLVAEGRDDVLHALDDMEVRGLGAIVVRFFEHERDEERVGDAQAPGKPKRGCGVVCRARDPAAEQGPEHEADAERRADEAEVLGALMRLAYVRDNRLRDGEV